METVGTSEKLINTRLHGATSQKAVIFNYAILSFDSDINVLFTKMIYMFSLNISRPYTYISYFLKLKFWRWDYLVYTVNCNQKNI
jgi:hypothetical protein